MASLVTEIVPPSTVATIELYCFLIRGSKQHHRPEDADSRTSVKSNKVGQWQEDWLPDVSKDQTTLKQGLKIQMHLQEHKSM